MSQDFRQMSQGVTRLIEATVKFRKLAFVGLSKKYQGKVRGNPEDNEVIRAFVGTYSPAVYAYYSSYASAAIREEKRSHTVFKSARVGVSTNSTRRCRMKGWGWVKGLGGLLMAFVFALDVPALSQAQLFPVSADVATVRADLLLWATALIGMALAIYAFKRVRAIVG